MVERQLVHDVRVGHGCVSLAPELLSWSCYVLCALHNANTRVYRGMFEYHRRQAACRVHGVSPALAWDAAGAPLCREQRPYVLDLDLHICSPSLPELRGRTEAGVARHACGGRGRNRAGGLFRSSMCSSLSAPLDTWMNTDALLESCFILVFSDCRRAVWKCSIEAMRVVPQSHRAVRFAVSPRAVPLPRAASARHVARAETEEIDPTTGQAYPNPQVRSKLPR